MYDTKPPMPAAMTPGDRMVVVGLVVAIVLLAAASVAYLVSVRRVVRVGEFVGHVFQVLTERPKYIGTDLATQDDLAVRGHGDDQVRN